MEGLITCWGGSGLHTVALQFWQSFVIESVLCSSVLNHLQSNALSFIILSLRGRNKRFSYRVGACVVH